MGASALDIGLLGYEGYEGFKLCYDNKRFSKGDNLTLKEDFLKVNEQTGYSVPSSISLGGRVYKNTSSYDGGIKFDEAHSHGTFISDPKNRIRNSNTWENNTHRITQTFDKKGGGSSWSITPKAGGAIMDVHSQKLKTFFENAGYQNYTRDKWLIAVDIGISLIGLLPTIPSDVQEAANAA